MYDYNNANLKDATVRITYSYHNGTSWQPHELLGQRLTEEDGMTFFIGDSQTEMLIRAWHPCCEESYILKTFGDESFPRSGPIEIWLKPTDETPDHNVWIYIRRDFSNRSLDLTGIITAMDRDWETIRLRMS